MKTENINKFKKWLISQGCEILPLTNEYEELRFKGRHVGVLYGSGKTSNQYTNNAILCWRSGLKWDGGPVKVGRNSSSKKQKILLIERDGSNCFYCGKPLGEDITIEHLMALNNGGKNSLGNMVLAHRWCNNEAGTLNIVEKVNFAINKRYESSL